MQPVRLILLASHLAVFFSKKISQISQISAQANRLMVSNLDLISMIFALSLQ
jgi:hypothetical protein